VGSRCVDAHAEGGINVPVVYSGGHLIDGGVTSLIPVRAARAMGADIVIAVDIYRHESCGWNQRSFRHLPVMHDQSCLIARQEVAEADILISPSVGAMKMSDTQQQDRAVESGYMAARAVLSALNARAITGLPD
jgi:NTE family protein